MKDSSFNLLFIAFRVSRKNFSNGLSERAKITRFPLRILLKILRISLRFSSKHRNAFSIYNRCNFLKKVHLLRNVGSRAAHFPTSRCEEKQKMRENFRFPLWKATRSWEISIERRGFGKWATFRKTRISFPCHQHFHRKTRSLSRRCSIRRLPPIFPPGRNKRFDLCLRRSLRDADDLWIVARSFHLASFRVTSRLVVHRHCASFPPLVNPWIHNNLKIIITFSRSSMEKLDEKSRGYMFCLFISGHERQGADTKVNTNGRKIITYTNKLGV